MRCETGKDVEKKIKTLAEKEKWHGNFIGGLDKKNVNAKRSYNINGKNYETMKSAAAAVGVSLKQFARLADKYDSSPRKEMSFEVRALKEITFKPYDN